MIFSHILKLKYVTIEVLDHFRQTKCIIMDNFEPKHRLKSHFWQKWAKIAQFWTLNWKLWVVRIFWTPGINSTTQNLLKNTSYTHGLSRPKKLHHFLLNFWSENSLNYQNFQAFYKAIFSPLWSRVQSFFLLSKSFSVLQQDSHT